MQDEKGTRNFLATSKITAKRSRDFLLALANLREDRAEWFLDKFGEFLFPSSRQRRERELEELAGWGQVKGWTTPTTFTADSENREKLARARWHYLRGFQDGLRAAWGEPELVRQWRIHELRWEWWRGIVINDPRGKLDASAVPPNTWFMQATTYLLKQRLAKICENSTCNIEKFYFAEKGRQKYCSDECARPAILAAKMRWWKRNKERQLAKKK